MTPGVLIVGGGQAGLQIAITLREKAYDEAVTIVGAENSAPYSRPPLSKGYLGGAADLDSLLLRAPEFYATRRIAHLGGERVAAVHLDVTAGDGSGVAETATGRQLPFSRLALATGARSRELDIPGAHLSGVCYLRSVDDALHLRTRLEAATDVVVVGGGFIGLEGAATAAAAGKGVTIIEAAPRLLGRAAAPLVSDFYLRAHAKRGARVMLDTGITAFEGTEGEVEAVLLADGTRIRADLVLIGIGVEPRVELAQQMGLLCDRGIVVDVRARTSNPHVVAAGDCTVGPHPLTGNGMYRLESVQNATAQAHTAALTLLGETRSAPEVPWFWSDQFDLKLQIAGIPSDYDHQVVRGRPDDESFSVISYRDGQLIAVESVNDAPSYIAVRTALAKGITIPPERAADETVSLKEELLARSSGSRG